MTILFDVPCLSAQSDNSVLDIVKDYIFNHGTMSSQTPEPIQELVKHPRGITVQWCKVDGDFDAQDYRHQFHKCTSSHLEDIHVTLTWNSQHCT